MSKITGLFIIFFVWSWHINFAQAKSHLEELKELYPFGLLTDDYGILDKDDLKINACVAYPEPISETSISYSYWQCFETKRTRMICDGQNYDPEEKVTMTLLLIQSSIKGVEHEFMSRRPMPLSSCQLFRKDWIRLTSQERYVCVSGVVSSKDLIDGITKWFWVFDRYKTKKGCDSYFMGECNIRSRAHKDCLKKTILMRTEEH